ncbi:MAG: MFS transporter [Deltaproteobacteria bacterium]|nr:MAG: MFS transporter [Deltaproteobacteria bacterium]
MISDFGFQEKFRWGIIVAAFLIMAVISIYQYSWFLFAYAIREQFGWALDTIGLTFTVYTYTATFVQPLSGYVADSMGPRPVSVVASMLVAAGLLLASFTSSPKLFYLYYGLGGLGVGILYGVSTSCAIKWFPDRRGFATGTVVFGFGAGTAIFNLIIESLLKAQGLSSTLRILSVAMMLLLLPLSLFYKYPDGRAPALSSLGTSNFGDDLPFKPLAIFKTYQWYLIYFSFVFTVSIVLLFGAQMKMLADEFAIPVPYFSIVLVLFPLGNGLSRVVSGVISDKIGRGRTMVLFYALLAISILAFLAFAHIPALFVTTVFAASLLGGAPFALYPATIGDFYGAKYATTNYGITYTAKAWAGLISGWFSAYLVIRFGSYRIPLIVLAICSLLAAIFSHPKLMKPPIKR